MQQLALHGFDVPPKVRRGPRLTFRQFYDSHPEGCGCFACEAAKPVIAQLGGRCPEHNVVRQVCRCKSTTLVS